jgi:hypothetical protein
VSAIRRRQRAAAVGSATLILILASAFIDDVIEKPDGMVEGATP